MRFDGTVICGLFRKASYTDGVVVSRGRKLGLFEETNYSPVFVPSTTPRYRSDARLSSPRLEQALIIRLNRQGERSELLIRDDEGWMGRIVVLDQYLTWTAKFPTVS